METYTQAMMDLGSTVCTRNAPRCDACPVGSNCSARRLNRVAGIPAPRPRKALPRKTTTWLLALDRRQILMEKRPATGIWGGLWSFPEAPARDVAGYCRRVLGCELRSAKPLEALQHGFTHFRLEIQPLLCEVRRTPHLETPGRLWTDLAEAARSAVPSPVRTLLGRVAAA
jgi:A/G-specific adenine glycosylase